MNAGEIKSLKKIYLRNFKNVVVDSDGLSLGALNVFIGPNGSGKSNLLGCLRLLSDSLAVNPSADRGVTSFDEAIESLGAQRILDIGLDRPATVTFGYEFTPTSLAPKGGLLELEVYVADRKPYICREVLSDARKTKSSTPFYYYKCHDLKPTEGVVSFYKDKNHNKSEFKNLSAVPTNQLSLTYLPELLEGISHSPDETPVYPYRRQLIEAISQWRFYNANDMSLEAIRTAEPQIGPNDVFLAPSGKNLPLVLDNLVQTDYEFEERLNNAMKAILPETRRVRAVRSGRLNLTVEWYMGDNGKEPFYLSDLSDGTVRMLCWAIILHSPISPSLLVIDEPELSLHPAWMPVLAEWIKMASRKTQVVVCTHSPDLLDHFTDSLESVVSFNKKDGTHWFPSKLPIGELSPKLAEGWQLGDLYRVGDPGVRGWPW